jgi:hypothetical protein
VIEEKTLGAEDTNINELRKLRQFHQAGILTTSDRYFGPIRPEL